MNKFNDYRQQRVLLISSTCTLSADRAAGHMDVAIKGVFKPNLRDMSITERLKKETWNAT